MNTLTSLKQNIKLSPAVAEGKSFEQQQEEYEAFLNFLGIELGEGLPELNLYETNMEGTPCIRVARNMQDLNAYEPQLMEIAENLQAPVIHALPLDSFGATSHLPGIGPIPIARVYGGGLFSEWGLSGHHLTPGPIQIIRQESSKKMPMSKRPYTQFLKDATEWKAPLGTKEGVALLIEEASKSSDQIGMAAAMQLSLGRGTTQGIFTFNPEAELAGGELPTFSPGDWMLSDLGRAVVEETPMTRRAMTFAHLALVKALDMEMYNVVPTVVGDSIRKQIEKAREQLALS